MTRELLVELGVSLPTATDEFADWLLRATKQVAHINALSHAALGLFMYQAREARTWEAMGFSSWGEYCKVATGLDVSQASKCYTTAYYLLVVLGIAPFALGETRDIESNYLIAARMKAALKTATTPERRAQLQQEARDLLALAGDMGRRDLQKTMDDRQLPPAGECRRYRRVCTFLEAEPNPDDCAVCQGAVLDP